MASAELQQCTQKLLDEFQKGWTLDVQDLRQPETSERFESLLLRQPTQYQDRLRSELFEFGPLGSLFRSPATEILILGWNEIWFECGGRLQRHEDTFLHPVTFRRCMDRMMGDAGVVLDQTRPFVDGRWRDFRLHLVHPSRTRGEFQITLRRNQTATWSLTGLAEVGWCAQAHLDSLRAGIDARKNIIVVGPTGAGKTTVLSSMLKYVPDNERAVILEDSDEIEIPNAVSTKLLTRPESEAFSEIPLAGLLRQSLRMRPDRLIVGEVRGPEAKDLLMALSTGHAGSLCTLHAADARQAILRLEMLVQMGAPQWDVQAVRRLIQLSLDWIVVCGFQKNQRHLVEIQKVAGLESFGLLLEPVV